MEASDIEKISSLEEAKAALLSIISRDKFFTEFLEETKKSLKSGAFFRAKFIKQFESHSEFLAYDKALLKEFYDKNDRVVCIDINNNCCNVMTDFEVARDQKTYPLKVYKLIRTSDVIK